MGDFQYKDGETWKDIPDAAKPDREGGSITVEYPLARGRDGNGYLCGAVGNQRIVIRFTRMLGTGMAFWNAFFANPTSLSVVIFVTAFDPRSAAWLKYYGILHRPEVAVIQAGNPTWYRDGEISIDILGTAF